MRRSQRPQHGGLRALARRRARCPRPRESAVAPRCPGAHHRSHRPGRCDLARYLGRRRPCPNRGSRCPPPRNATGRRPWCPAGRAHGCRLGAEDSRVLFPPCGGPARHRTRRCVVRTGGAAALRFAGVVPQRAPVCWSPPSLPAFASRRGCLACAPYSGSGGNGGHRAPSQVRAQRDRGRVHPTEPAAHVRTATGARHRRQRHPQRDGDPPSQHRHHPGLGHRQQPTGKRATSHAGPATPGHCSRTPRAIHRNRHSLTHQPERAAPPGGPFAICHRPRGKPRTGRADALDKD